MGSAIGDAAGSATEVAAAHFVSWPTRTGITNARTEGYDLLVKTVKCSACRCFVIVRTRRGGYAFTAPVDSGRPHFSFHADCPHKVEEPSNCASLVIPA